MRDIQLIKIQAAATSECHALERYIGFYDSYTKYKVPRQKLGTWAK